MNIDLSKAAVPAGRGAPALTTQSDTYSVLLVPNRLVCRGMPFDQHLTLRRREACFQKKRLKSGN